MFFVVFRGLFSIILFVVLQQRSKWTWKRWPERIGKIDRKGSGCVHLFSSLLEWAFHGSKTSSADFFRSALNHPTKRWTIYHRLSERETTTEKNLSFFLIFWIKTQHTKILYCRMVMAAAYIYALHNKKTKRLNWRQTLIVSFTPRHLTSNWVEMEWARGCDTKVDTLKHESTTWEHSPSSFFHSLVWFIYLMCFPYINNRLNYYFMCDPLQKSETLETIINCCLLDFDEKLRTKEFRDGFIDGLDISCIVGVELQQFQGSK